MARRDTELQEEIGKLKSDLFLTRMALIDMAPATYRELLTGFFGCNSYEDAHKWHKETVEKILERVMPKPAAEMGGYHANSDRAYCPLCGGSSDNIQGIEGFAFPEGLRRHLEGSYNARHCSIMKAALALARESADSARERIPSIRSSEPRPRRSAPRSKR